ncbi:MAG TPA: hypothetical protein VI913_03950, partial [Candidatus Peribacteraceae bacterium]|nr:hypothetical protein [Candidatus Peribacteraceae bacterium]
KVEIPRPTKEDASNIFRIHSAGVPLHKVTQDEIIAFAVEELFSDKHALYEIQRKSGTPTQFTLGHMASGAMIKGVVERSKSLALQRDRKAGSKTGVTAEDVRIAVKEKLIENIHLAPVGSVIKFTEDFQEDVLKIKTLKQVRA